MTTLYFLFRCGASFKYSPVTSHLSPATRILNENQSFHALKREPYSVSILPLYLPLSLSLSQFQLKFVLFFPHFNYLVALFQGHWPCRNFTLTGPHCSFQV